MAQFNPQKIDLSQINGGQRYGYEGISPEAINRPIEASAYAQQVADIANATSQKALEEIRANQGTGEGITGLTAYPIGSIYISTNNTSPAILFGGTWEQFNEDKIYTWHGTEIVTISPSTNIRYMLHTLAQIKDKFLELYGVTIDTNYMSIVIFNGDMVAQNTEISGYGIANGGVQIIVDKLVDGLLRVNFCYLVTMSDPSYHWKRIG